MIKSEVKELFKYARSSIAFSFENSSFKPDSVPEVLHEEHGVFVTLTLNNELRGCIGLINPVPLWKGVINAARSSAFSDPRFMPLSKEEFNDVLIELSMLSVPEKTTLTSIKKGDGVIISMHGYGALFLPQVWNELTSKDEFLSQLCLKAGLESDSYKNKNMRFEKFNVEAWKELIPNGDISKEL